MRQTIIGKQYDEERALYNIKDADITNTVFAGPADGESALKEARNITLTDCSFSLRYPLWRTLGFKMERTTMDELTRAAIWYSNDGEIVDSTLGGIKALRECKNIRIAGSEVVSPEFGWNTHNVSVSNTGITSEYAFLNSSDLHLSGVHFSGKYSFQYVENMTIEDSILDTKDAFWHSKNVTVKNSTIKGEYLAWYSEGLTLIGCRIIGTQPLCYCKGLKLIDCTMEECDLAFEYSDVDATVCGTIDSVKNPKSGEIVCDGVGEVIMEDAVIPCAGKVTIRKNSICGCRNNATTRGKAA